MFLNNNKQDLIFHWFVKFIKKAERFRLSSVLIKACKILAQFNN